MPRKRYAAVGISNRNIHMFMKPILTAYRDYAELVAMLDKDRGRMTAAGKELNCPTPHFLPEQFDRMVAETRPDTIIVACQDGLHHHYIIEALRHNLNVISEKPLTIDEEKCAAIARAAAKSKGQVTVTFNYRYAPAATKIRELVAEGRVGRVVNADLTWYLDTYHGASYFMRWNRYREVSGGLSIHKACHHFDLVKWWIGQRPADVFAFGRRNFYGPNGAHNPLTPEQVGDGRTCLTCNVRPKCKYFMRWYRPELRGSGPISDDTARPAKAYEGYVPRMCVFDPAINIEDTYAAVIRYDGGAYLNYSLNASVPYEGFDLGINGTEGRIEYRELHGGDRRLPFPDPGRGKVLYYPMFGGREEISVINAGGGHGGGDPLLLDELFIGSDPTAPVARQAGLEDGIEAVLTGVAVHRAANEQRIMSVTEMKKRVFGY